ncbi:MAG: thymidylate synthase (FAD) [Rickettsiales bacterium]|jgi:thymidylate synthase (FAD)
MNLPINCYTQWYWKIDLHNLLNFLFLRADSHAQYEIREYANIMLDITKKWVPHCYEAFIKYRQSGKEFSGSAVEVLKKKLKGEKVTQEESGLSLREWIDLEKTFGL